MINIIYNIIKYQIQKMQAKNRREKQLESDFKDMEIFIKQLRKGLRVPPDLIGEDK